MADNVNEILLRITGDDDDASNSIEKIVGLLEVLDSQDADADVNVRGTSEALGELSALSAALRAISGDEAHISVDLDSTDALGNLAALNSALRATGFDIPVHLNPSDAFLELARLQREANIEGEVDISLAGEDEVQHSLRTLQVAVERLTLPRHEVQLDVQGLSKALGDLSLLDLAVGRDTLDINIGADLDSELAMRKLSELRAAELSANGEIHIKADANTAGASAKLISLSALAQALGSKDVNIDVETKGASKAQNDLNLVNRLFGQLASGASAVGSAFGGAGVNIGPFTTALNPFTAAAILVVLGLFSQLIAAVAAVAASFAAAVAGVVSLATAFAAALGPAILIIVATISRLASIFQVLKAQDAAAQDQAQKSAQGHRAATQAAQQRADAAENLARAEADLGRAASQAYRDMADAAEKARDAVTSLARAELSREQAALGLERAKLDLKQYREELGLVGDDIAKAFDKFTNVRFDPKRLNSELAKIKTPGGGSLDEDAELKLKELILSIKDARLRQKEATDGVSDAQTNLTRATQDYNKYIKDGIAANPGYIAALRARTDAQKALTRAQQDTGVDASVAKAATGFAKLSAAEQKLLGVIKQVRDIWKTLFSGATNSLISAAADVLKQISDAMAPLKPLFDRSGAAMAGAFQSLATVLTPKLVDLIESFSGTLDKLGAPVVNGIAAIAKIFINLAKAALPFLVPAFEAIAGWLTDIANKSANMKGLNDLVAFFMDNLRDWIDLIKAVGAVLLAAFKPASDEGQNLVRWLTDILNKFAAFLNTKEGRQEVIDFFKNSVQFAKDFLTALGFIVKVIILIGTTTTTIINGAVKAWNGLKDAVNFVVKAIQNVSKWIDKATEDFTVFVSNIPEMLRNLSKEMSDAAAELGLSIVKGLIHGIEDLGGKLLDKAGGLAGKVIGAIGSKFKINSPSKVMVEMGKGVVEGLKLGLESGSTEIGKVATRSLAVPVIKGVNLAPVGASAGSGATSGVGAGINIENVNIPAAPGHDEMGDARHQAALFMAELKRRGR